MNIKLASGIWGRRLKDLAADQELIKANKLDEKLSRELIPKSKASSSKSSS